MKKIFFVLLLVTFLTGCAGKKEINDLALVLAVGIDKSEKVENGVQVTVQVARPADARGQTGAPTGNTGDPIWSASADGQTLFEAIRNLTTISTRRVFWAHNFAIVVNEDLAREGIHDIIDFFTRNPELRMRTWIMVTPDRASTVVSTLTGLEVIPGEAIDKLFRYTEVSRAAPRSELLDVQSAYLSNTNHPVIARVKLIGRGVSNKKAGQAGAYEQIELAGAGVFNEDKLVGTLTQEETRGLLPFIETVKSGVIVVPCPKDSNKQMSAEIISQNFAVTPKYENGKPKYDVRLLVNANIVEAGCPFSIENREEVKQLQKEIKKVLSSDIQTVLNKAQKEFKLDFLELGQVFNNRFPSEWKGIRNNWDNLFTQAVVNVEIETDITSSVLLYDPTRSGKD
ncbi:Ger(x)C family spore germination protein [Bacillus sp. HMF5848]|uniref:Ger(x)C family spore germination protein n=1 Tax=Bacillus sp. HMF5848 TaxID=2495421 RepID=UPI000F79DE5D|nr:Ger(x)C family spore germination protein [Bacillus sp. HMF5848]RSK25636.1 Ger(x)C family spore germination protein [Bacillus sp. HMF5848]